MIESVKFLKKTAAKLRESTVSVMHAVWNELLNVVATPVETFEQRTVRLWLQGHA